ncbi:MAG: DNA-protecting protein DprA [Rickettsiales bacterium]|jgi:DNA processing protein|nr:DNA-protecting protein DprA [Rickettsiales bacterium]
MEEKVTEDMFYKLLLFRSKGVGAVKYKNLVRSFGGAKAAAESLQVPDDVADSVKREMDLAAKLGIKYIADDSPDFPELYKRAENHEPIISVRGNSDALKKRCVGMVGTRHATAHGIRFMSDIAKEFARHNFTVASGMAIGTDGAAHKGALLEPGDANTIAVLAGGADYAWPPENERLYFEIMERGCVVSAMPVGYVPNANNFVMRNKIIAGLSELLILGEASEKSGSVATANFMLALSRPLWAIPSHPTDGRSAAPNRFIGEGRAKLCRGASDFFETGVKNGAGEKSENEHSGILDLIGSVPTSESVLTSLVKKNISDVMSALVVLELKGLIKKVDGGYVLA